MTLPLMSSPERMIALTRTLSPSWERVTPVLSVLIPFYKDDPRPLLKALSKQAGRDVEVILIDDGCPDTALNTAVREDVINTSTAALVLSAETNLGRAGARNQLALHARADWYLFLDADMQIPEQFLERWKRVLATTRHDAIFGGYTPCEPRSKAQTLHAAFAAASDAPDAATRTNHGAVAVCSSNLAVRCRLYENVPFDEGYSGWGWEDVDWALSANERGDLGHEDVQASHDGLQTVDALIDKFDAAGVNFARLLTRHPEYASRPGAKLANLVRRSRLGPMIRPLTKAMARQESLPMAIRVSALKMFRAAAAARDIAQGLRHE